MLTELLKKSKPLLVRTNSYLLPRLDKIIDLLACVEKTAGSEFTDAFKCSKLPKGEYLLRAGDICHNIWFLEKGIARVFACKNGMEVTQYFFVPAEIIESFCSSAFQKPSESNIQLLRNSVVYSISNSNMKKLEAKYPLIKEIEKLLLECHANWMEEFFLNMQFLTAEERYEYLRVTQPYLIECISTNHLASYLCLSRKSLTRSRKSKFNLAKVW